MAAHHAVHPDDGGGGVLIDGRFLHLLCLHHGCVTGLEQPQPQGIGHHEDTAHAHGRRAQHGAELQAEGRIQRTGGDGDAQGIVEEGPEEVLLDVPDGGPAQLHRTGHLA